MTTVYSPQLASNEELKKFLIDFYKVTDTRPNSAEEDPYPGFFIPDGRLQVGKERSQGHKDIAQFRQKHWSTLESSEHFVHNVASVGSNYEIFINGDVPSTFSDKSNLTIGFASYAELVKSDDGLKFKSYKVYIA